MTRPPEPPDAAPAHRHGGNGWLRALRWGLGLGSISALSWLVEWAAVGTALAGASLIWLGLMYFVALLLRAMEAPQMWLLLRWIAVRLSVGRVFFANALAAFYGLLVPGDLVAAGAKWEDLSIASGRRALILNAIVYNRLLMLLPAILFGSVAVIWLTPPSPVQADLALSAVAAAAATGLMALGSRRVGARVAAGLVTLAGWIPHPVGRPLVKIAAAMAPFQAIGSRRYLSLLALSTLVVPVRAAIVGLGYQIAVALGWAGQRWPTPGGRGCHSD